MSRVAAVVLAAGASTRFGEPKQRLLVPEVLKRLAATSVDEAVVVEGAHPLGLPSNSLLLGLPVRVVRAAGWEEGPGASLRAGLAALPEDVEAAVIVLGDGPDLAPGSVERVLDAWRSRSDPRAVVAASYGGVRGHPVVVGREAWQEVPAAGLRALPAVPVPCDDLGAPGDVDEPGDLPPRLR